MIDFYTSLHCTLQVHCKTCRHLINGKSFRTSMLNSFTGLDKIDFECPLNKEWNREVPLTYLVVAKNIIDSNNKELKEELRLIEEYIELNKDKNSPCWLNKQRHRIIEQYLVAKDKNLI